MPPTLPARARAIGGPSRTSPTRTPVYLLTLELNPCASKSNVAFKQDWTLHLVPRWRYGTTVHVRLNGSNINNKRGMRIQMVGAARGVFGVLYAVR